MQLSPKYYLALAFFQAIRSLFSSPPSAVPVNDLSFGLIQARGIKPMLEQRQWKEFENAATSLAPDDLTRLLDGLCLSAHYVPLLEQYQKSGESELQQLMAGVHATFQAWEARSGAYAKELSQSQIDGFSHYLHIAYSKLNTQFATPNLQVEASARLVRVAMGLSDLDLAQAAYKHCTALQPNHLQAHLFYFNVLTPKWFGDEDALEDFVDAASNSALHDLLQAMYLVELQSITDDSTEIAKENVKNENRRRINELLAKQPLVSDSLYAIYFNNYLACLNHTLGNPIVRNSFLAKLEGRITAYPWAYFGLTPQAVRKLSVTPAS
jgi:hypothetical protein